MKESQNRKPDPAFLSGHLMADEDDAESDGMRGANGFGYRQIESAGNNT